MVLSKEAFKEIVKKHSTLLIVDEDAACALYFAADVIEAEIKALNEKCPYATRTIDSLESALHEVYELARDADGEDFSEEG